MGNAFFFVGKQHICPRATKPTKLPWPCYKYSFAKTFFLTISPVLLNQHQHAGVETRCLCYDTSADLLSVWLPFLK